MTPTPLDWFKYVIFPLIFGLYLYHKFVVRRWQHEDALEETNQTQAQRGRTAPNDNP